MKKEFEIAMNGGFVNEQGGLQLYFTSQNPGQELETLEAFGSASMMTKESDDVNLTINIGIGAFIDNGLAGMGMREGDHDVVYGVRHKANLEALRQELLKAAERLGKIEYRTEDEEDDPLGCSPIIPREMV